MTRMLGLLLQQTVIRKSPPVLTPFLFLSIDTFGKAVDNYKPWTRATLQISTYWTKFSPLFFFHAMGVSFHNFNMIPLESIIAFPPPSLRVEVVLPAFPSVHVCGGYRGHNNRFDGALGMEWVHFGRLVSRVWV